MTEKIYLETYLNISPYEFGIYLFDKKNLTNLYQQEIKFKYNNKIDFKLLNKFLEENIFKIEKLIGNFVNNVYVLIDYYKITNLSFGIKKKNYQENIKQDFLEEILTESKDLFKKLSSFVTLTSSGIASRIIIFFSISVTIPICEKL